MYRVIAVVLLICGTVPGHSGRTDSRGGHNDRKNGGYHYHNSGYKKAVSPITASTSAVGRTSSYFVQSSLKLLGYYSGTIDGLWGRGTKSSLVSFQKVHGLPETATLNTKTKAKLLSCLDEITIK